MIASVNARSPITECPWFWIHAFSAAALIGMLLIGPKAEEVQSQRDGNFTRRQLSLERQSQRANHAGLPANDAVRDTSRADGGDEGINAAFHGSEPRYVTFTPFYALLGGLMAFSWCMLWRRRLFAKQAVDSPPSEAV